MSLNEVQQKAADTLDKNIVLSAGAGTGKTKVLTNRFLNILKTNDIEDILAITFTKKATSEMKNKILQELINTNREEYKFFNKSNIYTIHGFCNVVVKSHVLDLELNPNYEVLEESQAKTLLNETIDEVLLRQPRNSFLFEFLYKEDYIKLDSFKYSLESLINSMNNLSISLSELKEKNKNFNDGLKDYSKINYDKLIYLLEEYDKSITSKSKFKKYVAEGKFDDFKKNPTIDKLDEILENLGSSTKSDIKTILESIESEIFEINLNRERENFQTYEFIVDLIEEVQKLYKTKKKELGVLDYDDLEKYALKILKNKKQTPYKYIMVDEFQDTNKRQVEILRCLTNNLSKDINLFVVGDKKQSIYGFRGSDLEQFESFSKELIENGALYLEMEVNYRSTDTLIKSFNKIFKNLLKEDYKSLVANLSGGDKIKCLKYKNEDSEENVVADYISHLIGKGIEPNEIGVLYRNNSEIIKLHKELVKRSIEVNNSNETLLDNRMIKDILLFLDVLIDKNNIISLLSFLKSPMCGISENSIFILANFFHKVKFESLTEDLIEESIEESINEEDIVQNLINEVDETDKEKLKRAINFLNKYRDLLHLISLNELLVKVFRDFNIYEKAEILYGDLTVNNLNKLLELSYEFDLTNRDLCEFKNFLQTKPKEDVSKGVNLLSIHKSKGLEYKYLIVCQLQKDLTKGPISQKFNIGSNGIGISGKIKGKYIQNKIEELKKKICEEKRIFYVALTRAKENLILPINEEKLTKEQSMYNYIFKDSFNDYEDVEITVEKIEEKTNNTLNFNLKLVDVVDEDFNFGKINLESSFIKYYSATTLINYLENKDKFFSAYILKDDNINFGKEYKEELLPPKIRGLIIHKIAEKRPIEVRQFIEEQLKYSGIEYDENIIETLLTLSENLDKFGYLKDDARIEREKKFLFEIYGEIIVGFIDEIRNINNEIHIVDYKTSKLTEKSKEIYSHQLRIYKMALDKIYGKKVSEAILISLEDGENFKVDISEEKMQETKKLLLEFFNYVKSFEEI